jgi:acyl-coenzyme A synthetase/AMP-(fatty) acid ligase
MSLSTAGGRRYPVTKALIDTGFRPDGLPSRTSDCRVSLSDVERELLEHPAVAESAVIGSLHLGGDQIVKAFVVLAAGHHPSERLAWELRSHVRAMTTPISRHRTIVFVSALPRTAMFGTARCACRRQE